MVLARDDAFTPSQAEYEAVIYTPLTSYCYRARLSASGEVALVAAAAPAPAELERRLATLARVIARKAASNSRDGVPPWPQRIQRWRAT